MTTGDRPDLYEHLARPSTGDPMTTVEDDTRAAAEASREGEITAMNERWTSDRLPVRFADATVSQPDVYAWAREIADAALAAAAIGYPCIRRGRSLLIAGPVGRGKTHEAYGAMAELTTRGALCRWELVHEMDLLARLRPRHGVDHEDVFELYAGTDVLVLDDVGAERPRSEWVEAQILRLVNRRYELERPTVVTTNVAPGQLGEVLGQRVASRLAEMCGEPVVLGGPDRRRVAG